MRSISTATTANTRTLSHSPSATSGSALRATDRSKKDARTRGHPGASSRTTASTSATTAVLTVASAAERRDRLRR